MLCKREGDETRLVLADFGVSAIMVPGRTLSRAMTTLWTCAPEILLNASYGSAADVWAAGCVFLHMYDGEPPLRGKNREDQLCLTKEAVVTRDDDETPPLARAAMSWDANDRPTARELAMRARGDTMGATEWTVSRTGESSNPLVKHGWRGELNLRMRHILVVWLIEVGTMFRCDSYELHVAVTMMDEFVNANAVMRKELQCVGVTALLVASKCAGPYAHAVKELAQCAGACTIEDICAMERRLLRNARVSLTAIDVLAARGVQGVHPVADATLLKRLDPREAADACQQDPPPAWLRDALELRAVKKRIRFLLRDADVQG